MRAGGREAFLWGAVKTVASTLQRPLVVFIRDVEHTICSTFERHDGFVSAFGSVAQPGSSSAGEEDGRKCWTVLHVSLAAQRSGYVCQLGISPSM